MSSTETGDSSDLEPPSSMDRLDSYHTKMTGLSLEDREKTIPALAMRSYHLPNHTWTQDWWQYQANNHPVLGICCHHKLHPVRFWMRILILCGSICFGLAVTNCIWLWFYYNTDETVLVLSVGTFLNHTGLSEGQPEDDRGIQQHEAHITKGMIVLWTLGGVLHAVFDNTIWYISACVCCLPGQAFGHLERYRRIGTYMVMIAVVLAAAAATMVIVIRASLDDSHKAARDSLADVSSGGIYEDVKDPTAWEFLISYAIELALALCVYYPVLATLLFSGILGCGKIPVLGGRPYEIAREEKQARRKSLKGRSSLSEV